MSKITAVDFQRHLEQVVDPVILGQISLKNREIACDGMACALNKPQQIERGGHSR